MRNSVFNHNGNTLITLMVVSAVALTGLIGVMQVAANYSKELGNERKATSQRTKKEMALEYLLSKFISRQMANGTRGVEWSIQTVGGKVKVTANSSYCYQTGCNALTDPMKVPIRDVYRRWTLINGQRMCVLVSPYQEFQGAVDPQLHCAPFYDEYIKDGSNLASLQNEATLDATEKQKAYVTVSDIEKFTKAQQDQYLAGTLSAADTIQGLTPVRVTFRTYEQKPAPDPDILTVAFDDGDQGNVLLVKPPQPCGTFTACTGTVAECMAQADTGLPMSGGASSMVGTDKILTYTSAGTLNVTREGKALVLLVGGGAGGNAGYVCDQSWRSVGLKGGGGGGGGGGQVLYGVYKFCVGSTSITVGPGGAGAANTIGGNIKCPQAATAKDGGASLIGNLRALGGTAPLYTSSGGNSGSAQNGGTGGYKVNSGGGRGSWAECFNGGGGGGAGSMGGNWNNSSTFGVGGDGGAGIWLDISGVQTAYGGGGGGGGFQCPPINQPGGSGGAGGGGSGAYTHLVGAGNRQQFSGTNGAANSGGGGGGGRIQGCGMINYETIPAGSGGSGIVIIRYK